MSSKYPEPNPRRFVVNEDEAETVFEEHLRERGWNLLDFAATRKRWREHLDGEEADRAFFYEGKLVSILEAKKPGKDLWAALEQGKRYARTYKKNSGQDVPLVFATDGQVFLRQNLRANTLPERITAFPTPAEFGEFFRPQAAELQGTLRDYQRVAVSQVLGAVQSGRRRMYGRLRDDAWWLRAFLAERGVQVQPESILEKALFAAENFPGWSENPETFPAELKLRGALSYALGLSYLVRAIAKASASPHFEGIARLLPDLATGNPLMTEAGKSSEQRNLVFELEVACIFCAAGLPTVSSVEPDVAVEFRGHWNLPCKMIFSENPVTVGDRLEEGIRQCLDHPCDFGIVFLGISNRLDHDSFMPVLDEDNHVWGTYRTQEAAADDLIRAHTKVLDELRNQAIARFHRGRNEPRFRGAIIISHTVCSVRKMPMMNSRADLVARSALLGGPEIVGPEKDLFDRFLRTAETLGTD